MGFLKKRLVFVAMAAGLGVLQAQEVMMPDEEFKRLEEHEARTLSQADRTFAAREYPAATAAYDSFIMEFPRSRAVPYALLRKARSLHRDNKRFEAIREYNEVLEYFPNRVPYAAPALFYMGQAHLENGHEENALRTWRRMVEDSEYVKHPLAAGALNRLADALVGQGRWPEAVRFYRKVAVDFRTQNRSAANHGIGRVTQYHTRIRPDEGQLREFYAEVRSFHRHPRRIPDDLSGDRGYWGAIRDLVGRHGRFNDDQRREAREYYTYWAGVLLPQQRDWDDFQISAIGWQYQADGNKADWIRRLDRQFEAHQKDGDFLRIVRWIRIYGDERPKAMEYYNKIDFSKMNATEIFALMRALYEDVGDSTMAGNAFRQFKWNEIPDRARGQADKVDIARYLWRRNPGQVEEIYRRMDDQDLGQIELLRFYANRNEVDKAIPVAEGLSNHPEYAEEAVWTLAEMYQRARRFREAIATYRRVDRVPDNMWRIVDCHVGLGEIDQAIGILREIENFFENQAPRAALQIANLYNRAGDRDNYLAHLRHVLRRYPASGQSNEAHLALEREGERRLHGGLEDARD